MKALKAFLTFLIVVVVLALLAVIVGVIFFKSSFNKTTYIGESFSLVESLEPETYIDPEGNIQTEEQGTLPSNVEKDIQSEIEAAVSSAIEKDPVTPVNNSDVYNLLLIGVDRRNSSWYGNSDTIVLLTINYKKETIYMTSIMRDSAANIPGVGVKKINAACAHGGPNLLVQTVESNYGVHIDNFAMVDFDSMASIVDMVGGVSLPVTDDEARVCNQYIAVYCTEKGILAEPHYFNGAGTYNMTGVQAVAYSRNRYSGGTYDYGRTQRQRIVLEALFNKFRTYDAKTMVEKFYQILPYLGHNLDESTVLSFAGQLTELSNFTIVQDRIPYDGYYHFEGELLVNDWGRTIDKLHQTIY